MSLLADNTLASVGNSFYLTKNEPDAGDITVNSIVVKGDNVNPSIVSEDGDAIIEGGKLLINPNFGYVAPGNTLIPDVALNVNGWSKFSSGHDLQTRLIIGPAPGSGNYDYCSMITANNQFSTNYSSNLGFWTHGNASTAGDPTLRMTIDSSGNVSVLGSGNLTVGGTVSSANIPALPMLPAQTNYAVTPVQVPINISAGVQTTNLGGTITVPKTGMYVLLGSFNYDGAAGDGITFGSADFLAIRLEPVGPGTPRGVNVNLRNCLGDNDGTCSNMFPVLLDSTVTYQPKAIMYNISGVSAITGTPNYYGGYLLTALC